MHLPGNLIVPMVMMFLHKYHMYQTPSPHASVAL
jgi:hypothetical protein